MDMSEVMKLDAPAKITKLSQAIRIGAKLRPQGRGQLLYRGASCALGAAIEGMGLTPCDDMNFKDLQDMFGSTLCAFVIDWNDNHGLTREQIADKLEALGF